MQRIQSTIISWRLAIVVLIPLCTSYEYLRAGETSSQTEKRSPAESKVTNGGALFELLVPDRAWTIPDNKEGARTSVKLQLRITNQTDKPLRFSRFDTISPRMNGPDDKPLHPDGGRHETLPAHESDFPLVAPGKTTTFAIDADLFRQNGKLRFGGSDGFGGVWGFSEEFTTGRYQVSVHYENHEDKAEVSEKVAQGDRVRTGLWTGAVDTPFINVSIVEPGTRTVVKRRAGEFGPEVKGLKASVSLAKSSFAVGEPIETTFTVKNVSDARQIIWHSGFWPNHQLIVRDAAGNEPSLTADGSKRRKAFSPGGERGKNAPWETAPGSEDSTEGRYDLTKLYDLSKPGRYTVQCIYEERQTGWQGRLASNEAAFEIK
jgi:hypothetical protein